MQNITIFKSRMNDHNFLIQKELYRKGFLIFLTLIAAAVFCRYWIDLPVARWCWNLQHSHEYSYIGQKFYSSVIHEFLVLAEVFGNFVGAVIAAILILELDRRHRFRFHRVLTAALLAGLIVNITKLFIIRRRPQGIQFSEPESIQQYDTLLIDWTPWTSAIKSIDCSFPSGHTATAFAIFVVLSFYYPQGKRVFLTLAILAGIQRIVVGAHFPSDVVVGAMIGIFAGGACTVFTSLSKKFNRWEGECLV